MSKKTAKSGQRPKNAEKRGTIEVIIRKKILGEAPVERHFIVADGRKLKNILDLADALETMSSEVFKHHANDAKNDFSNWVKDVFEDHSLADDISRAKDKLQAQVVVLRRLIKELM